MLMILYSAPGACSVADHIALQEAGMDFQVCTVDLKTHRTEDGRDFYEINPKGYVPALQFDDGTRLTENIAILSWISDQGKLPLPAGPLGRWRLLEALAYISNEVHKGFKPFFNPSATAADKTAAGEVLVQRFHYLAKQMRDQFLLGPDFTVADAYLFVMLTWAQKNSLKLPDVLTLYFERISKRPAVKRALENKSSFNAGAPQQGSQRASA